MTIILYLFVTFLIFSLHVMDFSILYVIMFFGKNAEQRLLPLHHHTPSKHQQVRGSGGKAGFLGGESENTANFVLRQKVNLT